MKFFLQGITVRDLLTILFMCSLMIMAKTHNLVFLLIPMVGSLLLIRHPECIFPLYYMSATSNAYFSLGGGLSLGRYLSLLVIISLFIKLKNLNYGKNALFPVLTLIILTLLSTMISYTGSFDLFIQMLQCFLVLYLLQKYVTIDIGRFMTYIGIASAIIVVFVFFEAINNSAFEFAMRFRGDEGEINANRIGMMMEQCGAVMMAFFFLSKNKLVKYATLVVYLCAVLIVIATGSRSAFLAILISIPVCMMLIGSVYVKKIIIPTLILLMVAYSTFGYIAGLDAQTLERFSFQSVEETGGTGRLDNINKIMTEIFPEHLWFGSGIGGSNMKALGKQYNLQNLAHNIVIDPLSQMGIIIYSIFIFILVRFLKPTFIYMRKYKWYIIPISLLCSATMNGVGETIFYEKFFWNDIALCMLCGNIVIAGFVKEDACESI